MEENEIKETENSVEETQESSVEVGEVADESPTLEDYQEAIKKVKTLEAQKEHWRKKAESVKLDTAKPELKTNEYLTRDEAILLSKGYDSDDLDKLNTLAKANGKKLSEVAEDEMFVAWKEMKDKKVKSEKAQLGSSKSSVSKSSKPVSEMTPEEHYQYWKERTQK